MGGKKNAEAKGKGRKPSASGPQDILIGVMGMPGSGKTTFINTVTGGNLKVEHGMESCTQEIQTCRTTIDGKAVTFIDMPGFDNADQSDISVLEKIAEHLKSGSGATKDVRLSAIIYLQRIDTRIGATALAYLRMFKNLVGDKNFGNVLLLTTMWDVVGDEQAARRQAELVWKGKFWVGMAAGGARYDRHDGTRDSALALCRSLVNNSPRVLQIQEELARDSSLSDTSAGREVLTEPAKMKEEYEKQIQALKAKLLKVSIDLVLLRETGLCWTN